MKTILIIILTSLVVIFIVAMLNFASYGDSKNQQTDNKNENSSN